MICVPLCTMGLHWSTLVPPAMTGVRNRGRREGLQLRSWFPKMGTTLQLSKADPINKDNPVAMVLRGSEGHCGLLSTGFWGVPVLSGATYHLSLYLRNPSQELQVWTLHLAVETGLLH